MEGLFPRMYEDDAREVAPRGAAEAAAGHAAAGAVFDPLGALADGADPVQPAVSLVH